MEGFGSDNPKIKALQARQDPNVYIQYWKTPLMKTCTERPGYCCYAVWCSQCASYQNRKQALHGDLSRYICCNGMCPCSGRCGESSCPGFCLCMEAFFCFSMSVQTTRYMIQDELRIHTTKCDNCIIVTMVVLEYVACICHIVACITGSEEIRQAAQIVQLIADLVWCSVCACMQTQHKIELDERDKNPGMVPPPLPGMPPAVQVIPMGGAQQHGYQYPPPGGQGYPLSRIPLRGMPRDTLPRGTLPRHILPRATQLRLRTHTHRSPTQGHHQPTHSSTCRGDGPIPRQERIFV